MEFVSTKKIKLLYSLIRQAFSPYKLQFFNMIVLGILAGFFEGIGVNAAIPLFSYITGGQNKGTDSISIFIEKHFSNFQIFQLKYLLLLVIALFLIRTIFLYYANYYKSKITYEYETGVRKILFNQTLAAKWPFLLKQKLGNVETILLNNVRMSSLMFEHLSSAFITIASLFIYVCIAINISVVITVVTLIFGVFLLIIFIPLINKTRIYAKETEKINRSVSHFINENTIGMKTVKISGVEGKVGELAGNYFENIKINTLKLNILKIILSSIMQPIGLIFLVLVFAIFFRRPDFNLAALAAIMYLIQKVFLYVQQLQGNMHRIVESAPYLQQIINYEKISKDNQENDEGIANFIFNHSLRFSDVSFSYVPEKIIFKKLNLEIKQGEMLALVGPSGGGKTTVADLILRLFTPNAGQIILDNENIDNIDIKKWRCNIGYVSQDIFLVNDTIRNNIKYYDDNIAEGDIIRAAKMANIDEFIINSDKGYDTIVGDRGVLLSGGQRQRIAIARTLARKPSLLILDEATSALDNESEEEIQKVIKGLKGKITIIVIAHRLSTVKICDRLLALDQGKIVEEGSPEQLLNDKDSYFYKINNIN
jgi:ABC-type multidrug transport system fused ATPase/permease subunit